ncbi:hypothetical protein Dimus_038641 [Dionaea muscipula]
MEGNFQYVIAEAQGCTSQVHLYSKSELINDIVDVLTHVNELQMFKDSCFGNFLEFDTETVCSGALIHWLLVREIEVENAEPYEMWFGFGTTKARFSKYEFCLVTGLKFGDNESIIPSNSGAHSIHQTYFHRQLVTYEEVYNTLKDTDNFQQPEVTTKIALVLFVHGVLLGNDYRIKVPSFLWDLVEDISPFNAFKWASTCTP